MAHRRVLYNDGKISIYERTDEKGVWLCEDFISANASRALCFTAQGAVYITALVNTADKPLNRYIEPLNALTDCYSFCSDKNPTLREIKTSWLENLLEGSN